MTKSYVYAERNIENGKMNIGYKGSKGESKITYITSLSNEDFWEDYALGKMERSILFEGDDKIAKSVEWFALEYGCSVKPELMYNKSNNAHRGDESLLIPEIKKVVVDYIQGKGNGIVHESHFDSDKKLVAQIIEDIDNGHYKDSIKMISTKDAVKMDRNQVRDVDVDIAHAAEIKKRMIENPAKARETFGPIVAVVRKSNGPIIIDGNSRLYAASSTKGWNEVPMIFLNESLFGNSEKHRMNNYDLFGTSANKGEFEVKKPNNVATIKRNMNNFLVREGLINLSDPMIAERAWELLEDRFEEATNTKDQLKTAIEGVFKDYEKQQAEIKYQQNIITYDKKFFTDYKFDKYESKGVAAINVIMGQLEHGEAFAYICRRMRNVKAKKGAIIIHYKNKWEYAREQEEDWIGDLNSLIKYMKTFNPQLDIAIDVLPAFRQ